MTSLTGRQPIIRLPGARCRVQGSSMLNFLEGRALNLAPTGFTVAGYTTSHSQLGRYSQLV